MLTKLSVVSAFAAVLLIPAFAIARPNHRLANFIGTST